MNQRRLFEAVLSDAAAFYGMVRTELHGQKGVDIYSDEPIGSNISCFDFKGTGDDNYDSSGWDAEKFNKDDRHIWKDCELIDDDDGLYWESAEGNMGAVSKYTIVKAELRPKEIKLWVAPKDSSDDMGVLSFYKR
jgi:hypothetical protein